MKFLKTSIYLILFAVYPFSLFSQSASEEEKKKPRKNVVKVDFLASWSGAFFGSIERHVIGKYTIHFNYGLRSRAESGDGNFFVAGVKKQLFSFDNRFYLNNVDGMEPIEGFYVGPYLRYTTKFSENVSRTVIQDLPDGSGTVEISVRQDETINQFGTGLLVGFQSISFSGWVIDSYMGIGFYANTSIIATYPGAVPDYEIGKSDFRVGIQLGYSF